MDAVKGVSVSTTNLKAVDFFCGAGGVTYGFTKAGIDVLAGIDIDLNCKETYEKNNPNSVFLNKDISTYSPQNLRRSLGIKPNDDSLIFVGCSPCQYYSSVNNNRDKSSKGKLLLEDFQTFVDYFMPGYLFIENVPGLESDPESPLGRFKQFLTKKNYSLKDGVVNAKYLNVPQNRRRYVLLASRIQKDIDLPKENKENIPTVKETIGDLTLFPPILAGYKDPSEFLHTSSGLSERNLKRISKTSHNGGSRNEWANDPELQLECYKNHIGHQDVYGRMAWDRPSPTITTKFHSLTNGRYGHPSQNRAISLREGATLQSFPMNYKFYGTSQALIARMIGNAVPPNMAQNIGAALINTRNNAPI